MKKINLVQYNSADVLTILESVKKQASSFIESDTIEFKEYNSEKSLQGDASLAEEISAFANHRGGVIIVGVKDDSNLSSKIWSEQLVGFERVDIHKTGERLMGKIQNSIALRIENVSFEQNNYTAIFVNRDLSKIVTTTSGKTCIRDGRSSRPMKSEEIESTVKSLHTYDWSAEVLQDASTDLLNAEDLEEAFIKYRNSRNLPQLSKENFLETIEATKNGLITKGGLLFLGKESAIKDYLGQFEFRFSWKEGVDLKVNEVWSSNLWSSIKKAKDFVKKCVIEMDLEYKGNSYKAPNLDPLAFHEAFTNAVVHRDYSIDGMTSVEFTGKKLTILSPGGFYGGVTSDNIAYHEPRHRNKGLARILMQYQLVDRAGMGVLRMGVKSLVYGRAFPSFEETNKSIKVSMQTEFIRAGIFVLTRDKTELYIPDLILLNSLYEKGCLVLSDALNAIKKVTTDQWKGVTDFVSRWTQFTELAGSKDDVYLRVNENALQLFEVQKYFRTPETNEKCVKLYIFLKQHGSASTEDLVDILEHNHSSTTSRFLKDIKWLEKVGSGKNSKWKIISRLS